MVRFLPIVVIVLLMIYCVIEVAQSRPDEVRRAPRWLWAAAVIGLPLIGSVAWLLLGRPNAESIADAVDERFPFAPDDDQDFLNNLR
ncbi:MAG: PLD nuclease N-terminal domain-containing protein [Propionibacteriaceae bacterium]|nr:PLD nuclease N-terminal domain-containing protein [Propionibacteriaceae bacterium]